MPGKKELEIPVYLFMGFLESGKTTFIQDTLEEDYFNVCLRGRHGGVR